MTLLEAISILAIWNPTLWSATLKATAGAATSKQKRQQADPSDSDEKMKHYRAKLSACLQAIRLVQHGVVQTNKD